MAEKHIDYKTLSAELDNILAQMQVDDVDVDKAIALYERGMTITKELEAYLKTAENKVHKVKVKAGWKTGA